MKEYLSCFVWSEERGCRSQLSGTVVGHTVLRGSGQRLCSGQNHHNTETASLGLVWQQLIVVRERVTTSRGTPAWCSASSRGSVGAPGIRAPGQTSTHSCGSCQRDWVWHSGATRVSPRQYMGTIPGRGVSRTSELMVRRRRMPGSPGEPSRWLEIGASNWWTCWLDISRLTGDTGTSSRISTRWLGLRVLCRRRSWSAAAMGWPPARLCWPRPRARSVCRHSRR